MASPESEDDVPVSAIAPTIAVMTEPSRPTMRTRTNVIDIDAETDGEAEPSGKLPDVGDVVGHYVLAQKLGEGAHGAVYRAHRVGLEEHRVALKILPSTRERLPLVRQELVTLATVVHPNIVQLSDHDVEGTFAWFTMPFYEGTPLDVRLAERFAHKETLSLEEAYEIFHPLVGALAALHAAGFRHQDIKPENIFLARFADKEHPILLDLGVAISKDNQKFLAGTREYFAPEQLAAFLHVMHIRHSDPPPVLDEKMDIYGIAATLLLSIVGPAFAPGARLFRRESADLKLDEVWKQIDAAQRLREREPIAHKALRGLRGPPRRELEAAFKRWFNRDALVRPDAAEMASELSVLLAQKRHIEARRRRVARVALVATPLLLIGAPAAYLGGHSAVSLKECKEAVAADAIKSGQAAQTLQECQAQTDGLIQREKECSSHLTQARGERDQVEKEITGKLSSCTNADQQLKGIITICQLDKDTATNKAKECGAALTKSEDALKACTAAKADEDTQLAKAGTDLQTAQASLAKVTGDFTKCSADLEGAKGEAAKAEGDLAKCGGEKAECAIGASKCASDVVAARGASMQCTSDLSTCKAQLATVPKH